MKKYRATIVGIAIFVMMTLTLVGCDEAMQMAGPVMMEPETDPVEPVVNGEMKQPEPESTDPVEPEPTEPPVEPLGPIAIRFTLRDGNMNTIVGRENWEGPLYTTVTFSQPLERIVHFSPKIFMTLDNEKVLQYQEAEGDLISGTYRPEDNNSYLCKYEIPEGIFGELRVRVEVGDGAFTSRPPLHTLFLTCPVGTEGAEVINKYETDFIGRILTVLPTEEIDEGVVRYLPGVTLTILSGPRTGESTMSDRNGHYRFANVEGDELHLLVEKDCYEPKEVLVSRTNPTAIMPGRYTPNFENPFNFGREREVPGNITMGHAWPEPAKRLLEQIVVPYDLLYFKNPTQLINNAYGLYASRVGMVITASRNWSPTQFLQTLAHELAHARQHAAVSLDGSGRLPEWKNTPEGLAYEQARQRDWEEFGDDVLHVDTVQFYKDRLRESAAEFMAHVWLNTILGYDEWRQYDGRNPYEVAKTHAPHRLAWAQKWHKKP